MEPTVGPTRYQAGEWVVQETDVYTHRYKSRGPEHSIGFSVAHEPSNTRLVWGMKRLPDAKAVARWCNEECPSPKIERDDTEDSVKMPEESSAKLRAIVAAVENARYCKRSIVTQRKKPPAPECTHARGFVCNRCEWL